MTLLPIVERELRVASRRASTYWLRFFAALVILAVWIVLLVGTRPMSPAQLSQHIVTMLGSLTLGFCMLAGVFLTSDSVSSEKRDGTLGLLFLTDLRGFDIVLGKLVANSMHAFFGLLAAMPVLGLSLMMGGVTGAEFARFVLVFVVTLFASLTAGILISTLSHHAMRATAVTFLVVAFFGGILPALWWSQFTTFKSPIFDLLLVPSPPYLFRQAFDASYSARNGPYEFWQSLLVIAGLALASMVIACVMLPRVWQAGRTTRRFRIPRWFANRTAPEPVRTALAHTANPFIWLASRDLSARLISSRILMPLVGLCVVLLGISVFGSRNIPAFIACFTTAFGLHTFLKFLVAMEAGRRVNEDRQSGALELLLVTTLPIEAIIQGQQAALRAHFRWSLVLLTLLNFTMILAVLMFPKPLQMDDEAQFLFCELFVSGIVLLFADFYALSWLGLWRGLTHHNDRAVAGTLLKVMGIPWGFIVLLFATQPRVNEVEMFFIFAGLIATGLLIDWVIVKTARVKLTEHFRAAAADSYRPIQRFKAA
jgi:ABC-type transport system involved in multi-copper enzyme maturation permease subunit